MQSHSWSHPNATDHSETSTCIARQSLLVMFDSNNFSALVRVVFTCSQSSRHERASPLPTYRDPPTPHSAVSDASRGHPMAFPLLHLLSDAFYILSRTEMFLSRSLPYKSSLMSRLTPVLTPSVRLWFVRVLLSNWAAMTCSQLSFSRPPT